MLERERHRIILGVLQSRSIASVGEIAELTEASEATVRRDIAALALQKKLRKVRGGAEALNPSHYGQIAGRSFATAQTIRSVQKRAIAKAASELLADGEAIIINGGTTTFNLVHYMTERRLEVMTNSFQIAEHLIKHSKCTVLVPAGAVYREQSLIISPFDNDGIGNFGAHTMFMGAQGVSSLGVAEADPLIVQSEQRLMRQAERLVVMVDSTKFSARSPMIVATLDRVDTIVTDEGVPDKIAATIEAAGIRLVVAKTGGEAKAAGSAAA